jgi:hypothetical protein
MTNVTGYISDKAYQQFLAEIVHLVQNHRTIAVQTVQTISNQLYWSIGELIIQKQQKYGWGKSIVEQLSRDLNREIGDRVSWSPRNLWFMRQLVDEYSNLKQAVSEIEKQPDDKPSIGILLVPHHDRLEVEYALRTVSKPIGVAQYTLRKKLPRELQGKLPSAKEFQQLLQSDNNKQK